ncbi:hypothetical protein FHR71_001736 [Methylobacterium sp. RAS18]|nr:hypothetical protein [Methylobacterium sp. RAS18]
MVDLLMLVLLGIAPGGACLYLLEKASELQVERKNTRTGEPGGAE